MPTPGAPQKQLAKLAGNWTGDEVMAPSPWDAKGGTAKAKVTNHAACDGWIVVQEYEQARDGKVTFRGHGVFSFDEKKNQPVLHWFDSMAGGPGVFTGTWKGDVLTMTGASGVGGTARLTFDVTGGTYKFQMEASQDGKKWMELMRGTYKK